MNTKTIKAWIDGAVQEIEVEEMTSPEQGLSIEDRLVELEDKPIITDGNLLVGNGTEELEEMTPDEVLSHINGASVATMTTEEYEALGDDELNANTLYMLTDSEEVDVTLSVSGKAADAKVVGDALELKADKVDIVQSDFAQNDSTQLDYIKNRTHYAELNKVELLPEMSITTSSNQYGMAGQIGFVDGETYTIVWDGVEYQCVAGAVKYNGLPVVAVGNTVFIGGADTGEPFAICDITVNNLIGFMAMTDGTYTVSIFEEQEVVHQIDKKYLPDQKLSDFENDLYHPAKREAFVTLTPDDFTLNEEVGVYVYTASPKLDWLTSADVIGFELVNADSQIITEDIYTPIYESYDDSSCAVSLLDAIMLANAFDVVTEEATNNYTVCAALDDINIISSLTFYKKTPAKKIPEECIEITDIITDITDINTDITDINTDINDINEKLPSILTDSTATDLINLLSNMHYMDSFGYSITKFANDNGIVKNGIYAGGDGYYYYYKDNVAKNSGLVQLEDGSYIYGRDGGRLAIGNYWVTKNNDLLPSDMYTFNKEGKMTCTLTQELILATSDVEDTTLVIGDKLIIFLSISPNSLTVTMNGEDITDSVCSDNKMKIVIPKVTGDVVIKETVESAT